MSRSKTVRESVNIAAVTESVAQRYRHLPDDRRFRTARHVSCLYEQQQGLLGDPGFNKEFLDGDNAKFQQRYWELLLADHLTKIGLNVTRNESGADFKLELDGKTIWVEAVAPTPSDDIVEYYQDELRNRGGWHQADIFYLRWTQAISEKVNKFRTYIDRGRVDPTDVCIIAVNWGLLGSLGMTGKSDHPVAVDVLFGAGAEYAVIESSSMTIVEQGYRREPTTTKKNGKLVSKRFFLDVGVKHISAVLTSGSVPEMHLPFVTIHNPLAHNPLQRGTLSADCEYHAENYGRYFEVKRVG
jgi:hypothetical protein